MYRIAARVCNCLSLGCIPFVMCEGVHDLFIINFVMPHGG